MSSLTEISKPLAFSGHTNWTYYLVPKVALQLYYQMRQRKHHARSLEGSNLPNCEGNTSTMLVQLLPLREVQKVCKALLTESGLEGVQMQARDRLPPATKALAGNRVGWSHSQLLLHFTAGASSALPLTNK